MSRRAKIIIAVIILLVLLLGALAVWLLLTQQRPVGQVPAPTANTNVPQAGFNVNVQAPTTGTNVNAAPTTSQPQPQQPADERSNVRRIAAAFAERFGSFSNQTDFQNILDLKPLMTAKLQAWADAYVAEQRSSSSSETYAGVTTRALTTTVEKFDAAAGTATVRVRTQREQSSLSKDTVYYQDLLLEFAREGTVWKVDTATWQTP
jgi:hypothetical protein